MESQDYKNRDVQLNTLNRIWKLLLRQATCQLCPSFSNSLLLPSFFLCGTADEYARQVLHPKQHLQFSYSQPVSYLFLLTSYSQRTQRNTNELFSLNKNRYSKTKGSGELTRQGLTMQPRRLCSHYRDWDVDWDGFQITEILLFLFPKCWEQRCVPVTKKN